MHGHRQERDQTRGGQWDWASVSFQVDIIIVLCSIIALRYLPLGVLPSWSRSVCNS